MSTNDIKIKNITTCLNQDTTYPFQKQNSYETVFENESKKIIKLQQTQGFLNVSYNCLWSPLNGYKDISAICYDKNQNLENPPNSSDETILLTLYNFDDVALYNCVVNPLDLSFVDSSECYFIMITGPEEDADNIYLEKSNLLNYYIFNLETNKLIEKNSQDISNHNGVRSSFVYPHCIVIDANKNNNVIINTYAKISYFQKQNTTTYPYTLFLYKVTPNNLKTFCSNYNFKQSITINDLINIDETRKLCNNTVLKIQFSGDEPKTWTITPKTTDCSLIINHDAEIKIVDIFNQVVQSYTFDSSNVFISFDILKNNTIYLVFKNIDQSFVGNLDYTISLTLYESINTDILYEKIVTLIMDHDEELLETSTEIINDFIAYDIINLNDIIHNDS